MVEEQDVEVPPLYPVQLQDHGPLPLTDVALPEPQIPGSLEEPQVPLTEEQYAVVPPFNPTQRQIHGALPLTDVALPALQKPC